MTEEQTKAEVKRAVVDLFKAWRERDIDGYRRHAHADIYGFNTEAGLLFEGLPEGRLFAEIQAGWDAGQRSTSSPSHITVRPLGSDVAIATFYTQGSDTYPGGRTIEGTWRATMVMARDGGAWKCIHYHYSPLTTSQAERRS